MTNLINGRTPEEIRCGLHAHSQETLDCKECPYDGESRMDCSELMCLNALALIEHLESERDAALSKVPRWISVEERLPENEERVLITEWHDGFYGKPWCVVMTAFHTDGKTLAQDSDYNWSEGSVEIRYDEEADDFIVPEGWWEDVQCGDEFSMVDAKVTHWMPLPQPPEEKDA